MDTVYQYIKGQGWVAAYDEIYYATGLDHKTYKLTYRKPNPGERILQIRHNHPTLTVDDKVDMERVVKWFSERALAFNQWYLVGRRGYFHGHHTVVVEKC